MYSIFSTEKLIGSYTYSSQYTKQTCATENASVRYLQIHDVCFDWTLILKSSFCQKTYLKTSKLLVLLPQQEAESHCEWDAKTTDRTYKQLILLWNPVLTEKYQRRLFGWFQTSGFRELSSKIDKIWIIIRPFRFFGLSRFQYTKIFELRVI